MDVYTIQEKRAEERLKRIDQLKRTNPEEARKEAIRSLIRTGVMTCDGKPKDKIVSWE